jgi:hypothetical protein
MDYRNEALKIQKEIIVLIEREDFNGIENLLNKRKEFYIEYSKYNSEELKNFLNSQEYKDLEIKINIAFNTAKDKIKQEMDKIKSSKNASKQYQNNMGQLSGFFNKKI